MDGTTLFLGHFGMGHFRMGRFCMWAVLGLSVFIWDDLVSGPTSPESLVFSFHFAIFSGKFNYV